MAIKLRDLFPLVVCALPQMKHSSLCLMGRNIDIPVFLLGLLLSDLGLSSSSIYDLCTSHNNLCATKNSSPESHIEVAAHCQVCMRHDPFCWLQHIGRRGSLDLSVSEED